MRIEVEKIKVKKKKIRMDFFNPNEIALIKLHLKVGNHSANHLCHTPVQKVAVLLEPSINFKEEEVAVCIFCRGCNILFRFIS